MKTILILHDIRSAENVGSLFRTADAVGVDHIYLTGITPTPIDRFGRPNQKIIKASLGAEKSIPWKSFDIYSALKELSTARFQIIGIEQNAISVDYRHVSLGESAAFILGNEVGGIPEDILALCDVIAEIPLRGKKESLNVSVAGGVALFRILGK